MLPKTTRKYKQIIVILNTEKLPELKFNSRSNRETKESSSLRE
jgi:hypothetical protein